MDNLRGLDSDRSPLDDLDGEYVVDDPEDTGADDAGLDRPPAIGTDERRMQVRAYNFWTRLLFDNDYPLIDDLDPANPMDFGDYSVLLDFTGGLENPAINYVGRAIVEECELEGPIGHLDDVHPRSLLSRITDHYMQIHANRAPIGFEAEFVNQRGATILYRGILLPFSSDGTVIDYIFGVINWKEAVGGAEADELQLEVAQAFDSIAVEAPAMPAWADGPADAAPLEEALFDAPLVFDAFRDDEAEDGADERGDDEAGQLPRPGPNDTLHDWLHGARQAAELADLAERRGRQALYDAIGRAYDFALIAEREPETYAEMLTDSGLTVQARAPFTPLAKLVFGTGYDKSRIAEIAAVIGSAREADISLGECAGWIARYKGGVKAIVADSRSKRRIGDNWGPAETQDVHARLRTMPAMPLSAFDEGAGEFVVLVGRRSDDGVRLIGALEDNSKFTEKALKTLLR